MGATMAASFRLGPYQVVHSFWRGLERWAKENPTGRAPGSGFTVQARA